MKKIYPLLITVLFYSCNSDNTYTYIQLNDEGYSEWVEDEPKTFTAENDSIAYIRAFKMYVVGQRIARDMKEQFPDTYNTKPKNYFLLNSEGKLIDTPEGLKGQDSIYREIEERLNSR